MGADNAIDVAHAGDGWSWPPSSAHTGARARAHFRADGAAIAPPGTPPEHGTLAIDGTIAQRVYLGTQYRYRIHAGSDDVWVEDPQRRDEGTPVRVLVPPNALLVFPAAA